MRFLDPDDGCAFEGFDRVDRALEAEEEEFAACRDVPDEAVGDPELLIEAEVMDAVFDKRFRGVPERVLMLAEADDEFAFLPRPADDISRGRPGLGAVSAPVQALVMKLESRHWACLKGICAFGGVGLMFIWRQAL